MSVGYTPIYRIFKQDQDITNRFNDRTMSIEILFIGGNRESDLCSITLDDRDWCIAFFEVGIRLKVFLGYQGVALADMGSYEIGNVELLGQPRSIRLTGTSVGFTVVLKAPEIQSHDNLKVGEIIANIAEKGGASPVVSPGLAGQKVPFFNQTVSALHMLQELERRFGTLAKFEDGRLIFKPRGDGLSASEVPMPSLILQPEMFGRWPVRHSDRTAYGKSRASYSDKATGLTKWVEALNPGNDNLPPSQRDSVYTFGKQMNSEGEARATAKAVIDILRRQEVQASFSLAKGDPSVRDQMPIFVRKMRDGINGSFISDTVSHVFTKDQGVATDIEARALNTEDDFGPLAGDRFLGLDALKNLFPGRTMSGDGLQLGI